jgi:hypothetical protein
VLKSTDLPTWLETRVPDWDDRMGEARREFDVPGGTEASAYVLLAGGVGPYVRAAVERDDPGELKAIAQVLEDLFEGDHAVRDGLFNTLEELDDVRHRLWPHLGGAAREWFRQDIFWLPRHGRTNAHVSEAAYQARWLEEIEKLGGFERFDVYRELVIRHQLVREFRVRDLRAPQPGSREWQKAGLPWPLPPIT